MFWRPIMGSHANLMSLDLDHHNRVIEKRDQFIGLIGASQII